MAKKIPRADRDDLHEPDCPQGTHKSVLKEINDWTEDFAQPPIYLLVKFNGTETRSIARTIIDEYHRLENQQFSYFCSLGREDNIKFIFPTLAIRLAEKCSKFQTALLDADKKPGIFFGSLDRQLNEAILEPLNTSGVRDVIFVIDALDECTMDPSYDGLDTPEERVLNALVKYKTQIQEMRLKFFITSGLTEPQNSDEPIEPDEDYKKIDMRRYLETGTAKAVRFVDIGDHQQALTKDDQMALGCGMTTKEK